MYVCMYYLIYIQERDASGRRILLSDCEVRGDAVVGNKLTAFAKKTKKVQVCMYICMYVCMCSFHAFCPCVYVYMYMFMYVCMLIQRETEGEGERGEGEGRREGRREGERERRRRVKREKGGRWL
jgi:hypothetical protein